MGKKIFKKPKLTPKQELFAKEYLKDKNATRAAKAAGYSKKTAEKIGSENIRKPEVKKEIDKGLQRQAKRIEISADKIIQEIADIAFVRMNKFEKKHKSTNKLKALELVGKHFKCFVDQIESKVTATVAEVTPDQIAQEVDKLDKKY